MIPKWTAGHVLNWIRGTSFRENVIVGPTKARQILYLIQVEHIIEKGEPFFEDALFVNDESPEIPGMGALVERLFGTYEGSDNIKVPFLYNSEVRFSASDKIWFSAEDDQFLQRIWKKHGKKFTPDLQKEIDFPGSAYNDVKTAFMNGNSDVPVVPKACLLAQFWKGGKENGDGPVQGISEKVETA